jgi:hypothetical protein
MSLSMTPYTPGRRAPVAPRFAMRGVGAHALSQAGGGRGLASPLLARGYNPLARLAVGANLGGFGAGALELRGPARRNLLGGGGIYNADLLLRGGRYPNIDIRALEDILLSQNLGRHPYRDLEELLALGRYDRGRGYGHCDGNGCRGCGYNRSCEYERCPDVCHRCSGSSSNSSSSSSSKDSKTKDVVVRGRTYKIRKSFLADSSKFEGDIVKLLDKKSEDAVPNNVVQMLVDFINEESCKSNSILDFVQMSILASNLGVKSAVEYSLGVLKKEIDYEPSGVELTHICLAVLESSKVDEKLVEWLKRYLKYDGRADKLSFNPFYKGILQNKPELGVHLAQLLGFLEKDESEGAYRIL